MANPTTNFGWVMPTSSSLVTNLPADFNTFGQGVDTSLQYLLGGTTGQVLSKTSGTNMAFTWVTPTDQTPLTTKGDLFAFTTVDARLAVGANETRLVADSVQATGLKYVADTTNYAINAKADLLVGTAADTLAALTVGTNGQVLTADSTVSPTGLKWATASSGALTLVKRASFSGVANTGTTFDSVFSSTYKNYLVVIDEFTRASGGGSAQMQMLYSGTTQASGYYGASSGISVAAVTLVGVTNSATTQITLWSTLGTTGGATTISLNFSVDGTGSNYAYWHGTGFDGENGNQYALGGISGVARTYTGFLLKSSVANVNGTVSIYGLAK